MKEILAIEIATPFLRLARVEKKGSLFSIKELHLVPLTEADLVKQLYITPFKGKISSLLSNQEVLVRTSELKMKKSRYIQQALAFQAENSTLLPSNDFFSISHLIQKKKEGTSAYLCTISKKGLHHHLQFLQEIGIDPDFVLSKDLSLTAYMRWQFPHFSDGFVIDIAMNEICCLWIEKGILKKSYTLSEGIEALFSSFWQDRKKTFLFSEIEEAAKQIDLLQLKSNLNPHLFDKLSEMRQQISQTIHFFHRDAGQLPLIFTGITDAFIHLEPFFSLGFKELISNETFIRSNHPEYQKFAAPIGSAIHQLETPIQMRRHQFFPAKNWKTSGIYAVYLFLFSLFISAFFYFEGTYLLQKREEKIFFSLRQIEKSLNPSLKEEVFKNEAPSLEKWLSFVSLSNKESPYLLQAPKVSKVLDWLSHHNLWKKAKEEKEAIEIISLDYKLEEFPKIGNLKAPYLAKVEMELFIPNATRARQLHESLLQDEEMIDHLQDFSWEPLENSYLISFYLKNEKVPYAF